MEWQTPASKTYARGRRGGIKTGDTGILEICLGSRDNGFGGDGRFWVGKDMGQSDWESLVKDHLYIHVLHTHLSLFTVNKS